MCEWEKLNDPQFIRCRQLVKDEEVDVNCTEISGFTPLILLCRYNETVGLNCLNSLKLHLQLPDIQINQTDKDGRSSLMMALLCQSDQIIKIVKQLINFEGININQMDVFKSKSKRTRTW